MKYLICLVLIFSSSIGLARTSKLRFQNRKLKVSEKIPAFENKQKLYSIQKRAIPLEKRAEFLLQYGSMISGNDFLDTEQIGIEASYYFNNRWFISGGYQHVSNEFTNSAKNLADSQGFFPATDYATSRIEFLGKVNLFYGKFRLFSDQAFYFDQYIGLGLASHSLGSGQTSGPAAELGFGFRYTDWGSVHLGVRDYFYEEKTILGSQSNHHVNLFVKLGYLL